jgi:putative flavoprotein involved in K+ transport
MTMSAVDVTVIGAGTAGLGVSYLLSRAGCDHVVLERGVIGESWRSQRWDSFVMNTPNQFTRLPGQVDPGADPEAFESRDAFVSGLTQYADASSLPVQLGVEVIAVEQRNEGGFIVALADGGQLDTRAVVVASGLMHEPRVPAFDAQLPPAMHRVHASQYRNPDALPRGAVLVVGSAQSGCQITEDLLASKRRVYLSTGRVGRSPRRYRGRDVFAWNVETGALETTVAQLPDPSLAHVAQPQISGVGPRGRSVSLQQLAAAGVTLLGHLEGIDGVTLQLRDDTADNIRFADHASVELKRNIDEFIDQHGVDAPPRSADPQDPGDVPCADPDAFSSPTSLNLEAADIRSIIWCTGFGADFSWLRVPVLDEHGLPQHHDGISAVAGLYFVGFPWLRRLASGLVYGIADDAQFIVNHVLARLAGQSPVQ